MQTLSDQRGTSLALPSTNWPLAKRRVPRLFTPWASLWLPSRTWNARSAAPRVSLHGSLLVFNPHVLSKHSDHFPLNDLYSSTLLPAVFDRQFAGGNDGSLERIPRHASEHRGLKLTWWPLATLGHLLFLWKLSTQRCAHSAWIGDGSHAWSPGTVQPCNRTWAWAGKAAEIEDSLLPVPQQPEKLPLFVDVS